MFLYFNLNFISNYHNPFFHFYVEWLIHQCAKYLIRMIILLMISFLFFFTKKQKNIHTLHYYFKRRHITIIRLRSSTENVFSGWLLFIVFVINLETVCVQSNTKKTQKCFHNFKGVLLIQTVFSQITRSIPCSYVFVHCYFLVKTKQLTGNPRPSGEVINIVTTPSPHITFRLRTWKDRSLTS